jgi:hypothetical protein
LPAPRGDSTAIGKGSKGSKGQEMLGLHLRVRFNYTSFTMESPQAPYKPKMLLIFSF